MLRRTLTILSLIGLLLSVGLWGASYMRIGYGGKHLLIAAYEGGIYFDRFVYEANAAEWFCEGFLNFETNWDSLFYDKEFGGNWRCFVPLWMPTVVFGVLFLSCRPLPFHRRRKRKKLGLCVKCGYDLRASKDRCPECGEAIG